MLAWVAVILKSPYGTLFSYGQLILVKKLKLLPPDVIF